MLHHPDCPAGHVGIRRSHCICDGTSIIAADFASIEARITAASRAAVEQRLAGLTDEKLGQLLEQVCCEVGKRLPQHRDECEQLCRSWRYGAILRRVERERKQHGRGCTCDDCDDFGK